MELNKKERLIAILGTLWFILATRDMYTSLLGIGRGLFLSVMISLLGSFLCLGYSGLRLQKNVNSIYVIVILLFGYLSLFKGAFVGAFLACVPWLLILLWPARLKEQIYKYYTLYILFYAVGSSVITIMAHVGVLDVIPHFVANYQTGVQEAHGVVNRIYGVFVVPLGLTEIAVRACGPFTEGGHFSIYLGFIYFIELLGYNKRHASLIIAGALTLSPLFFFFMITAEFVRASVTGSIPKMVKLLFLSVATAYFVYSILPETIKDVVYETVVERSLDRVIGQAQTGDIIAALDERTNYEGENLYQRFITNLDVNTLLFGYNSDEFGDSILSDFRAILIQRGLIGLILYTMFLLYASFRSSSKLVNLSLLLLGGVILLHRAWMMPHLTLYYLMITAADSFTRNQCVGKVRNYI